MDNPTNQPEFIGLAFNQSKKAELSSHEFFALKAFLEPFQMALATFNAVEQRLMSEKILVPYTQEDLDETGKLKEDFFKPTNPEVFETKDMD